MRGVTKVLKIKNIIFVVSVFLILLIFCILQFTNIGLKDERDIEIKIDIVNEKINELLESNIYINAQIEEREALARTILSNLEKEGYITDLSFSIKNNLFSFL